MPSGSRWLGKSSSPCLQRASPAPSGLARAARDRVIRYLVEGLLLPREPKPSVSDGAFPPFDESDRSRPSNRQQAKSAVSGFYPQQFSVAAAASKTLVRLYRPVKRPFDSLIRLSHPQGVPPAPRARFVSYLRVSTATQGRSGLGLEAQRQAVAAQVAAAGGQLVAEFEEVESGKRTDRPQLAAALAACRTRRAALVIAKLDRLARNASFLLSVVEGSGEAGVVFCDLPTVPAGPIGKFMVTQLAAVAELEAGLISQRTKAALAAAKARGVRLGNPSPPRATPAMAAAARAARSRQAAAQGAELLAAVRNVQAEGVSSLRAIARALAAQGVRTPGGRERWSAAQVRRVLQR